MSSLSRLLHEEAGIEPSDVESQSDQPNQAEVQLSRFQRFKNRYQTIDPETGKKRSLLTGLGIAFAATPKRGYHWMKNKFSKKKNVVSDDSTTTT